jgi:hypothetical protein
MMRCYAKRPPGSFAAQREMVVLSRRAKAGLPYACWRYHTKRKDMRRDRSPGLHSMLSHRRWMRRSNAPDSSLLVKRRLREELARDRRAAERIRDKHAALRAAGLAKCWRIA